MLWVQMGNSGDQSSKGDKRSKGSRPSGEARQSALLVAAGFDLARELKIDKVLVLAELLTDRRLVKQHRQEETLIWVAQEVEVFAKLEGLETSDKCIEIPEAKVDRMDQVTLGLLIAVMHGAIDRKEAVVCLAGVAGSKRLDNLLIANPERDFPWLRMRPIDGDAPLLASREFIRLIEIALKFAAEGREGKPIGTIFVLGNPDELAPFTKALILNPCKGHARKQRNIHDNAFVETKREYAAIDGAYLIDRSGVLESAGVYLNAPMKKNVVVAKGLGARHLAAATISARAEAIAIVISESSGTVTVFSQGAKVIAFSGREAAAMG